jgi:hypothetical protein
MATKQIIRRKEVRKDKIYTLRLTESDFVKYEEFCVNEQIRLADLVRDAIEKGIKERIKTIQRKKKA